MLKLLGGLLKTRQFSVHSNLPNTTSLPPSIFPPPAPLLLIIGHISNVSSIRVSLPLPVILHNLVKMKLHIQIVHPGSFSAQHSCVFSHVFQELPQSQGGSSRTRGDFAQLGSKLFLAENNLPSLLSASLTFTFFTLVLLLQSTSPTAPVIPNSRLLLNHQWSTMPLLDCLVLARTSLPVAPSLYACMNLKMKNELKGFETLQFDNTDQFTRLSAKHLWQEL